MPKLTMTRGLPGSGKSYWAKKQAEDNHNIVIVCKDDIRKQLAERGWVWAPKAEKDVINIRDSRIRTLLLHGRDVISADTNFGKHKDNLQKLAEDVGAEFDVKDFTNVPLEICLERNARRDEVERVPEQAIKDMYEKYIRLPDVVPYEPPVGKPEIIICDLDGTLALHTGRSPYNYDLLHTDRLNMPVWTIITGMKHVYKMPIVYLSGRPDSHREQTLAWLKEWACPTGDLFMRKAGDYRKDVVVKTELFNTHIRNNYRILFVLDDRDQVVKMWRKLGLTCLQVAEGAF